MNFADKVAEELAKRNRNVLPPIYVENGGKIGLNPGLGKLDQITISNEKYVSEFVDKLLENIPEQASLQFVELVLPSKAVSEAEHLISGNVHLRRIKTFQIGTDSEIQRFDALIRLPNDYLVKEKENV